MIKPWKLIKKKSIYHDKYLNIFLNTYKNGNGKLVYPCTVFSLPHWVNVVALTDKDKIILVQQYRHAANIINTGIPSGSIEKFDLNSKEAIRRELIEETGYVARKLILLNSTYPNPGRQNNVVSTFLAYGLLKKAKPINMINEEVQVACVDFVEFAKKTFESNYQVQSLFVASISCAIYYILHSKLDRFKRLKLRLKSELLE